MLSARLSQRPMRKPQGGYVTALLNHTSKCCDKDPERVLSTLLHQKLVDDLEGDTHGDFEDLLVALITPPEVYDCHEVINAIKVRLWRINVHMTRPCSKTC